MYTPLDEPDGEVSQSVGAQLTPAQSHTDWDGWPL